MDILSESFEIENYTKKSDEVENLCVPVCDPVISNSSNIDTVSPVNCTITSNDTMYVGKINFTSYSLQNSDYQTDSSNYEWCDSISEVLDYYAVDDSIFLESLNVDSAVQKI